MATDCEAVAPSADALEAVLGDTTVVVECSLPTADAADCNSTSPVDLSFRSVVVVVAGFVAALSCWMGRKVGVPSNVVETMGRRKPPPLASNSCAEILRTGVLAPEFSVLVSV